MTASVLPQNNLPPASVPWARAVESAIRVQDSKIQQLAAGSGSDNRATSGQLSSIGRNIERLALQQASISDQQEAIENQQNAIISQQSSIQGQVDELDARDLRTITAANLSLTANSTSFVYANRNNTIPNGMGSTRAALVTLSANLSSSGANVSTPTFVRVYAGSALLFAQRLGDSRDLGTYTISGSFVRNIPNSGLAVRLELSAQNQQTSLGSRTITLSSITYSTMMFNTI